MKLNRFFLGALVSLPLMGIATGCSDDEKWGVVDGADPSLALHSEHLHTEAGRSIRIKGTLQDADGIKTISLVCPELKLNKTIDLIDIYGEPQNEYELDYKFKIQDGETGDNFKIKVTVTDVAGKVKEGELLVTMDGDFVAPVFEVSPRRRPLSSSRRRHSSILSSM